MTWVVPAALEDAVYDATRGVVGDAPLTTAALVRAIIDRSKRYTSERERLAAPADRTADLAARAAFFTLADAMKVAIPLGELAGRGLVPQRRPLRVVDVGAGCGAMSLGLLATLGRACEPVVSGQASASRADRHDGARMPYGLLGRACPSDLELAITAIDRDTDALRIAGAAVRSVASGYGGRVEVTTRAADAVSTTLPRADLIVMGTVLNELAAEERPALVERALASIEPDGAVIVIEPALRETARALHELRDALLVAGRAHVFAPCTRRAAPCPALADPDDWCHEDRALTLPPRTAELARLTHLRDGGMKFAYLVLRHGDEPLVARDGAWRLVSAAHIAKGKHEIYGCGEPGRLVLRLLKRNRTQDNRAVERADRGAVVIASVTPEGDRVELAGAVDVIDPARTRGNTAG